jgi:uncharacterized damage-inducible protein DinB
MTTQSLAQPSAAVAATSFVQPLIVQVTFHQFALHRNIDGISQEQSMGSPDAGGNCLNWVLGHILTARNAWLGLVGEEPVWKDPASSLYQRGSAPLTDAAAAVPFTELVAAFDAAQQPLLAGLARLTPERLAEPAPFSPRKDPNETIASLVASLAFHEAYHIGQTGILRRVIGLGGAIA